MFLFKICLFLLSQPCMHCLLNKLPNLLGKVQTINDVISLPGEDLVESLKPAVNSLLEDLPIIDEIMEDDLLSPDASSLGLQTLVSNSKDTLKTNSLMEDFLNTKNLLASKKGCNSINSSFTLDEARQFVELHNKLRADIRFQQSSDMAEMIWDEELASRAQQWSDQCTWKHDMLTDCEGKYIGQNGYLQMTSKEPSHLNIRALVMCWYNEVKWFNFANNSCQQGKVCGHYTQTVWSKTFKVGCGWRFCPSVLMPKGNTEKGVVVYCDYSPGGNFNKRYPYKIGNTCQDCSKSLNGPNDGWICADGLCQKCIPQDVAGCKCSKQLKCLNGGVYNPETCSCVCSDGWFGDICEDPCECTDIKSPKKCQNYVSNGACKRNPKSAAKYCPVSCNLCNEREIPEDKCSESAVGLN